MNPDNPASPPLLFALDATRQFGESVASHLGLALSAHEEREFEDGEHKTRPLVNVRGRDVYVVQSLYSDNDRSVNDKLCRLLFFLGALRDASAASVTAVLPYLAYARKDRRSQPRDPVTTRYVAALFEAVGVDCVMTLDVHNIAAFQNAFRCRSEHLEANRLFVDFLKPVLRQETRITVVSPDIGGVKRAGRLREMLSHSLQRDITAGYFDKARAKGEVSFGRLSGEVADSHVIIIDDLISTGGTLHHAAQACRNQGARRVYAIATHGLFVPPAADAMADDCLDRVIVTDTIPPFRLPPALLNERVAVLSVTRLFAEAIRRLHAGGSLVELLSD